MHVAKIHGWVINFTGELYLDGNSHYISSLYHDLDSKSNRPDPSYSTHILICA